MATKFKAGDRVRQVMPKAIEGVVGEFAFDKTSGDIRVRVDWKDKDGHLNQRFFDESQIEAVTKGSKDAQ